MDEKCLTEHTFEKLKSTWYTLKVDSLTYYLLLYSTMKSLVSIFSPRSTPTIPKRFNASPGTSMTPTSLLLLLPMVKYASGTWKINELFTQKRKSLVRRLSWFSLFCSGTYILRVKKNNQEKLGKTTWTWKTSEKAKNNVWKPLRDKAWPLNDF